MRDVKGGPVIFSDSSARPKGILPPEVKCWGEGSDERSGWVEKTGELGTGR